MSETEPIDNNEKESINSRKKICRSSQNKIFLGLCGGIAEYSSFDPSILRFILLFSLFMTPFGLLGYLVAALLLPKDIAECDSFQIKKNNQKFLLGSILVFGGVFFLLKSFGFFKDFRFLFISNQFLIGLISIGLGIHNILFSVLEIPTTPVKKYYRSSTRKRFLGVCSGFAEYLSFDLKMVRIIFVLLSFFTFGITIIIYFFIAMNTKLEIKNYV